MSHAPHAVFPLLALFAAGCGSGYTPPPLAAAPAAPAATYPARTDLMVVKLLDGAPRRWPSNGFLPLKSARRPDLTPDRELADDLRKQFGKNVLDPAGLNPAQAEQLARRLGSAFGTPADPRVRLPDPDEKESKSASARADREAAAAAAAELGLGDAALARGSVLYRRWCLQCHGPTGAGDGAHAVELSAPPRDYRQGVFKFATAFPKPGQPKKGLGPSGKPRRDDLKRTVRHGIDGSMMPAFPTLSEAELDDLVGYVVHLSVRGETEFATLGQLVNENSDDYGSEGPALDRLVDQNLAAALHNWGVAARSPIPVPPDHCATADDRLASAFRGFKRYHSAEFGCASCHANYGREPQLKWDLWGTVVQPRNLVLGVYRGGRRGEDLYARLYGGIHPSGMTAFGNTLAAGPSYLDKPDKLWNLVHFLQALADPADRRRLQDPAALAAVKERLKAEGNPFLDDLAAVRLDP
jgi:mono/diheme cytochrome c family protein